MKKTTADKILRIIAPITALSLTLCGCGSADTITVSEETQADSSTEYSPGAYTSCFDYGSDGTLYTLTVEESGEFVVYPPLKEGEEELSIPVMHTVLNIFSSDGTETKSCIFDEDTSSRVLEYDNGAVYYIVRSYIDDVEVTSLRKYVLGESSPEILYLFEGEFQAKKTALINGTLYILGTDRSNIGRETYTDDFYNNSGEIILSYDLTDGELGTVLDKGAVEMSETPSGTLMIYAHDNDGFFFIEYDKDKGFSEKIHENLGMLSSFAMCGDKRYFYSGSDKKSAMGSIGEDGKTDIENDDWVNGTVKAFGNKICCLCSVPSEDGRSVTETRLVEKDITKALRVNLSDKLRIISAEYIYEAPPSLGFSVSQETVDYDGFSLTVLSQDPQYDMYLVNSRQVFAENIKSKGAFYPLNEVEGVKEYIDSCLPCLKNAAVNEDGDIWMLPVAMSAAVLAYFEDKTEKLGADMSELSAEEFIELVNEMFADEEKAKQVGYFNEVFYSELLLSNYLFSNGSFDTDEFRNIAKTVKEDIFEPGAFAEFSEGAEKAWGQGDFSEIAFEAAYHGYEHEKLSDIGAKVRSLPMMTDSPVPATCVFICVNPASNNIEKALGYIEAVAKYITGNPKNLLTENSPIYSESQYYKDLKEAYEKTEIRFSYSNELFLSEFFDYARGRRDLEEFIKEADRKLSIYLNE